MSVSVKLWAIAKSLNDIIIAGVDVGHQFFSRCEMVTVGFHNHWLNGIDYIGASKQQVIFLTRIYQY